MTDPSKDKEAKETKDEKKGDAAASGISEEAAPQSLLEAIEEDDEFEEFEPDNWTKTDEDAEDVQQWQDNWDDDDIEDDFTKNLRAELKGQL